MPNFRANGLVVVEKNADKQKDRQTDIAKYNIGYFLAEH